MDANELLACYAAGKRIVPGSDFRGANLFKANLRGIDLINADLSGADLSEAILREACLKEANLSDACLKKADLSGADLSGADLSKADLSRAYLFNANLSGADLSEADLSRAYLFNADLSGANLSGANLSGANLSGATLGEACLKEANLINANLSGADLFSVNLSKLNLINVILSKANLINAKLSKTNLINADLSGANLSGANLSGAYLFNASLSGANLSGVDLSKADLNRADLINADLINADLSGADLSGADLSYANLFKALLINANVSGSKLDGTILGYQKFSEELQQEKQELIDRLILLESQLKNKIEKSQGLILGCREILIAQQADFIQRLKSGYLLHCETENQYSELTVISGERLTQMRDFCWKMADKYKQKASVRNVFFNNLKGKLGEVAIKTRLGDFITEVDYEERIRGDGKVDFRLKNCQDIGIQVKARHGSIDTVQWVISAEEIEKNSVLVCVLIKEEISEAELKYHLILAGFLPTNMIKIKNGKARVAANELWYGGGLRNYLNLFETEKSH